MKRRPISLMVLAFLAGWNVATAQSTIHVPQDVSSLQQAIQQVSNGGVIEVSDGTYAVPSSGFRIQRPASFTIRAAAGATVILDGEGARPVLRMLNSGKVTFEGLSFENGYSATEARAGGVTIQGSEAVFTDCEFRDNAAEAPTTGGGGVRLADDSAASFVRCEWSGNSSLNRGGGVEVIASTVSIAHSTLEDNRVNLPGHKRSASGGGIYAHDSQVDVRNTRFENNQAGFSGGAIYTLGSWEDPVTVPTSKIVLVNSTLIGNQAVADPCCVHSAPTGGGAIHVENQATLDARTSRFVENSAEWGAVSTYRGRLEFTDCVFQGNEAVTHPDVIGSGAGGAVNLTASDFADSTTGGGTINRRPAELTATNTLFQGRFGAVTTTAKTGGCIFADGDVNSMYGEGGMPQNGTAADNRTKVELDDVIFADCDVDETVHGPGSGGAIYAKLSDVTMNDSLIFDSDALGDGSQGGGMLALGDSAVNISDTTWVGNSAVQRGGGVLLRGSDVQLTRNTFIANEVSPGVAERVQESEGAALYVFPGTSGNPARVRDVTGVVEDSLFVNNVGLPIMDIDFNTADDPINDVRYDGNQFRSTIFGTKVFTNNLATPGYTGSSVAELNAMVVVRSANGTSTDKSEVANQSLSSTPRFGMLVAAPSIVLGTNAPGDPAPPTSAFLGYAWTGTSAALDGVSVTQPAGLYEVTVAGDYDLRVNGSTADTATVSESTCTTDILLCLNKDRFTVEVDWRDFQGNTGNGQVVPFGSADSGLFWFFDEDNWEMLVKVLNGCGVNNRYWVFSAATTNVEYTLRVTDTETGNTKSYFNPLGTSAPAITDADAFATCPKSAAADWVVEPSPAPEALSFFPAEVGDMAPELTERADCTAGPTNMCLNASRFKVEVSWRDFQGNTDSGQVVLGGSNDSGLFWFFDEDNWEMLIKVLNGCGINNKYWVFSAATTNVEYTLRVTDTETNAVKQYFNPLGNSADAVTDATAFATCP
ncbi:MAG: hypothetical protein GY856_03570 [bacterium]|nr:hypothetical protein [bacterium]